MATNIKWNDFDFFFAFFGDILNFRMPQSCTPKLQMSTTAFKSINSKPFLLQGEYLELMESIHKVFLSAGMWQGYFVTFINDECM